MSDFGKHVIPAYLETGEAFMPMNFQVIGKMSVLSNPFGKQIWNTFHQKMLWIAVTANGRFTHVT